MAAPSKVGRAPRIDLESLERSLRRPRTLFSYLMSLLTGAATSGHFFPCFQYFTFY